MSTPGRSRRRLVQRRATQEDADSSSRHTSNAPDRDDQNQDEPTSSAAVESVPAMPLTVRMVETSKIKSLLLKYPRLVDEIRKQIREITTATATLYEESCYQTHLVKKLQEVVDDEDGNERDKEEFQAAGISALLDEVENFYEWVDAYGDQSDKEIRALIDDIAAFELMEPAMNEALAKCLEIARENEKIEAVRRLRKEQKAAEAEEALQENIDAAIAKASRTAAQKGKGHELDDDLEFDDADGEDTQDAPSQRRRQQEEEEENDDNDDDEDTESGTLVRTTVSKVFREIHEQKKAEYERQSAYEKYGQNNDYVEFRRKIHTSVFGFDVPLPDAQKWFGADGEATLPRRAAANAEKDTDEDDIVVARVLLDSKCALSLVEMTEPYSNHKCRHTFQKEAILQYLGNESKICPQVGCSTHFTKADLYHNETYLERIRRQNQQEETPADLQIFDPIFFPNTLLTADGEDTPDTEDPNAHGDIDVDTVMEDAAETVTLPRRVPIKREKSARP